MAESSSPPEPPQVGNEDLLELNKELDKMIEDVENVSVQLTCMTYDLVALRSSPELEASMRGLEEAHRRCRSAVCGDPDQEPEMEKCPETATDTLIKM